MYRYYIITLLFAVTLGGGQFAQAQNGGRVTEKEKTTVAEKMKPTAVRVSGNNIPKVTDNTSVIPVAPEDKMKPTPAKTNKPKASSSGTSDLTNKGKPVSKMTPTRKRQDW